MISNLISKISNLRMLSRGGAEVAEKQPGKNASSRSTIHRNTCSMMIVIAVGFNMTASADGIDVVPYLLRFGGDYSWIAVVGIVLLMMTINYALNFVVIGLAAIRFGNVSRSKVAKDLVGLTLLGQVADRIGAILAVIPAIVVTNLWEWDWAWPLLICNFLFSGLAVLLLARFFLRRRWQVPNRQAWLIAIIAGILTNPAWAMSTIFLPLP